MSGSAAASRDEQPDAWRIWSRRKEADEEEVKQEGANKKGEADEKEEAEEGKEEDDDKETEADEAEGGECGIHDGDAAGSRGGREDFQLALRPLASLPGLVFCFSSCFARLQGATGQEEDFVDCSSLGGGCQARHDQLLVDDFDMLLTVRTDRDRVRRRITKLPCECHFREKRSRTRMMMDVFRGLRAILCLPCLLTSFTLTMKVATRAPFVISGGQSRAAGSIHAVSWPSGDGAFCAMNFDDLFVDKKVFNFPQI